MFAVQEVEESRIEPPKDFSFPFTPYSIQKDFMKALFNALHEKKFGIFESPTGTGKSLSLLCGAFTWLHAYEERRIKDLRDYVSKFNLAEEEKIVESSTDWITAQHDLRKKKAALDKAKRELTFLEETIEKRKKALQNRKKKASFMKFHQHGMTGKSKEDSTAKKDDKGDEGEENDDYDYMFDDFGLDNYSDSDGSGGEDEGGEAEFVPVKIIFSSRTHSQLSQFVKELKRTSFSDKVTTTTLGSRQNLCINPEVTKLRSLALINEKCLDLQKGSKGVKSSENKKMKSCSGCPYFHQHRIEDLKNSILAEPMDIEELVKVAKEDKACPYYASRKAAKDAQMILMPYNTILHGGTRAGVGIKTRNSVLLLDEAHNIIESISNMYSNQINLAQLKECLAALEAYIKRYKIRFNPKNLLFLNQIKFIMKALVQFLERAKCDKNLFTVYEFRSAIEIDNLDLFQLNKFCEKYRLIFKLKGYIQQQRRLALKSLTEEPQKAKKQPMKVNKASAVPTGLAGIVNAAAAAWNSQSILQFAEFLKSLKSGDAEGRIIVDRPSNSYKFLLLNVAKQFLPLVSSARSIILAGGTMKPHDEVTDVLFAGKTERLTVFSCDHVIPDENLVCLALTKGPRGTTFDFTFKSRSSSEVLEELCQMLTNVVRIVPGGVVCFLPSYDYEGILYKYLQDSGNLERISSKKRIFREPKDGNCDGILADYTRQIQLNPNGAFLFAVVGGKLSEGINFSDQLGRCVLVVGMPYPNITSVEIQEKVKFATDSFGKEKGDALLTNMCSKAVNQSVGRAIRHAKDYAAILLIDQRFARPNQQALLPNWIQQRSQVCTNFGQAVGALGKFFSGKKQEEKQKMELQM